VAQRFRRSQSTSKSPRSVTIWSVRLELSNFRTCGPQCGRPTRSRQMFGKKALMDNLSRDLDRARDKRNALAFKLLLPMSRHSPLRSPSWKPAFLRKKICASASALGVRLRGSKSDSKTLPRRLLLSSRGFATRPRRRRQSFPKLASLIVFYYLLRQSRHRDRFLAARAAATGRRRLPLGRMALLNG